jgi:NAD+ kinase
VQSFPETRVTETGAVPLAGPIRRIGVVFRAPSPEADAIVHRVRQWAEEHDIAVAVEETAPGDDATVPSSLDFARDPVDLVLALGGDGTLLRASRLVVGTDIPVLGVNLGRLGFLTALPDSYLEGGLHQVISGKALLEHRFRLRAGIEIDGEPTDDAFFALNDIVVHTSGAARVTPLTLHVGRDGERQEVGSFSADGVILATPTGSTAYSMSAGGPIIVPEVECVVVTPICPHSLAVRPLVVPADTEICIGALDPSADHQVTVDGRVARHLAPGESLVARREARPLALVRLPGQTFFDTLRRKLNWAARPPERA